MEDHERARQVYGNPSILKKCVIDPKFAYVVALSRVLNALNSAHSLMMSAEGRDTPAALRDRMNSIFLVSGFLYEAIKLIRAMTKIFGGDQSFETNLRLILKDPSGQKLEQMHLRSVRDGSVFHFLPDRFADVIAKTPMTECVFATILGPQKGGIHYAFADIIAAEMMAGKRIDDAVVVNNMMEQTLALVTGFIEHSESFIEDQLIGWGFEVRSSPPAAPGSQSQVEKIRGPKLRCR